MFMSLRASTRANTLKNSWVFTQTYKPTLNNTSITCKHRLLESRGFFLFRKYSEATLHRMQNKAKIFISRKSCETHTINNSL